MGDYFGRPDAGHLDGDRQGGAATLTGMVKLLNGHFLGADVVYDNVSRLQSVYREYGSE